jgi:hypothetical protein
LVDSKVKPPIGRKTGRIGDKRARCISSGPFCRWERSSVRLIKAPPEIFISRHFRSNNSCHRSVNVTGKGQPGRLALPRIIQVNHF